MSKFLTGEELSKKVYDIIWKAEDFLFIVSPFIKLDDYFKELFDNHKYKHKLQITIIFGRNEARPSKSLRKEDFEFFKQFKNISIIYCPPLHAKYYANDFEGLLTSINLYDKCFETNIEYGVYFPDKFIEFGSNAEAKALDYTQDLLSKYPAVFIKRPVYEKKLLGKNYIESAVLYDATDMMLNPSKWNKELKKFCTDFPEFINAQEYNQRPEREQVKPMMPARDTTKAQSSENGFCIRTGKKIPYNTARPMCADAYKSWSQFNNPAYPEKYCHKTGVLSNGKTSMAKPVL